MAADHSDKRKAATAPEVGRNQSHQDQTTGRYYPPERLIPFTEWTLKIFLDNPVKFATVVNVRLDHLISGVLVKFWGSFHAAPMIFSPEKNQHAALLHVDRHLAATG